MNTQEATGALPVSDDREVRLWAMCVHFSLLAGFLVPLAGLIVPIAIWQLKKSDMPEIDAHGKIAANWIISLMIYTVISFVLSFVIWFVLPLLFALGIIGVVFPIIGGIKASNGEEWAYPLSIKFMK